jgi:hypothetical protein
MSPLGNHQQVYKELYTEIQSAGSGAPGTVPGPDVALALLAFGKAPPMVTFSRIKCPYCIARI